MSIELESSALKALQVNVCRNPTIKFDRQTKMMQAGPVCPICPSGIQILDVEQLLTSCLPCWHPPHTMMMTHARIVFVVQTWQKSYNDVTLPLSQN